MEFRNIMISNPARVSIRNGQLCIRQEQEITIPIEDISTLMLDSGQVLLTAQAMAALAAQGVTVIFSDRSHLPCAQLLPMNQFSRQRKLLAQQVSLSRPLQKQLWKAIVQQKIRNQARCLEILGREGGAELREIAAAVSSGDSENREAVAAALYFRCLFGQEFTRNLDCPINRQLNYGFAIIRSCVARNLVVHGLEPCWGIHHRNELNAFNLADDLVEPFRPLVELYVASNPSVEEALMPKEKQALFNLTNFLMEVSGKRFRVMTAVEKCAVSLSTSLEAGKNMLELPALLPLEQYRYG